MIDVGARLHCVICRREKIYSICGTMYNIRYDFWRNASKIVSFTL